MIKSLLLSFVLICLGCVSYGQNEVANQNPISYPATLVIRNGGYSFLDISFSRFQVPGLLTVYENKVEFIPDSVFTSSSKRKIFRYNRIIRPFSITYTSIDQVKYGLYVANFIPVRVPTILTLDGNKYRFSVKRPRSLISDLEKWGVK